MMQSRAALVVIATATLAVVSASRCAAQDAAATAANAELFLRAFVVFSHPRCSNCHPRDDRPRQGTSMRHVHTMNVQRGKETTEGEGAGAYGRPGMECRTCHQDSNGMLPGSPPGALNWRLAPKDMGWDGLTATELCLHLTDLAGRGFKVLDHIVEPDDNNGKKWTIDPLVEWAWNPGLDRDTPPVSRPDFIDLLKRWEEAGTPCPPK